MEDKGKKLLVIKTKADAEYYLSISGTKEDEILFSDFNKNNNTDINFLLYYYITTKDKVPRYNKESKFTYEPKGPGHVVLKLPDLSALSSKTNHKVNDLDLIVIMTQDSNELKYMDSICYLSKKNDIIESQNLYQNISINIDKSNNKVEIQKLDKNSNYFVNVMIINRKTGQRMSLDPLQIVPNKVITKNVTITVLVLILVVLVFTIFYLYRKYRIAKAIVNYENNDIKSMGSIPKSITELKKIQEEKNKKVKEKYNSLTEDSGEI